MTVVFAGAFRAWHGAAQLVEAVRLLRSRGVHDVQAVLIGDGPERAAAQEAARGLDGVIFTGAIAHERMPAALAAPMSAWRRSTWSAIRRFSWGSTGRR